LLWNVSPAWNISVDICKAQVILTSVLDIQRKYLVARMYRSVLTPDDVDRVLLEWYKLRISKFERFLETPSIHCYHVSSTMERSGNIRTSWNQRRVDANPCPLLEILPLHSVSIRYWKDKGRSTLERKSCHVGTSSSEVSPKTATCMNEYTWQALFHKLPVAEEISGEDS
jgi:hypothetical protein